MVALDGASGLIGDRLEIPTFFFFFLPCWTRGSQEIWAAGGCGRAVGIVFTGVRYRGDFVGGLSVRRWMG